MYNNAFNGVVIDDQMGIDIHPESFVAIIMEKDPDILDVLKNTDITNDHALQQTTERMIEMGLVPKGMDNKTQTYRWNEKQITAVLCCLAKQLNSFGIETSLNDSSAGEPIKQTNPYATGVIIRALTGASYTKFDPPKPSHTNNNKFKENSFVGQLSDDLKTKLKSLPIGKSSDLNALTKQLQDIGLEDHKIFTPEQTTLAISLYLKDTPYINIAQRINTVFKTRITNGHVEKLINPLTKKPFIPLAQESDIEAPPKKTSLIPPIKGF